MYAFSYYSYAPGCTYQTSGKAKLNDSPAVAHYVSGPYTELYVEVWGSDGSSGDARRLTSNGSSSYYLVNKGYYVTLHNTVYEYYVESGLSDTAYTSLKVYGYNGASSTTGTVAGEWTPSNE